MPLFGRARMVSGVRVFGLAAGAMLTTHAHRMLAQDVATPVEVHVPLLLKILNYDRNLSDKLRGEIPLGLLYQSKYRTSAIIAEGVRAAIAQIPEDVLSGYPVRVIAIDLDKADNLGQELVHHQIRILYLTPLRAVDLDTVLQASRGAGVLTITGVPRYVEMGVAIGIDRKGDRPQIVVNVAASRAEGADLSAQLLKLARVIK